MTVKRTPSPAAGFAALLRPVGALIIALALVACALVVGPTPAVAAPYNTTAEVPVDVTYTSTTTPDVQSPACSFELAPANDAAKEAGEAQTLTVSPEQTENFQGAGSGAFTVALPGFGTYEYTLTQTTTAQNGWTFDDTSWDVAIQVIRDEDTDEPIAIVRIMKDGLKYDVASFANTYTARWNGDKGAPTVKSHKALGVKLNGTVSDEKADLVAGAYTFELKDEDGNVVATATNDENGLVEFPALVHDQVGVYRYTLSEVKGDDANTEYDDKTVAVVITVTDDDGDGYLEGTVTYDGSEELPTFQNYVLKVKDHGVVVKPGGTVSGGGIPTTGDPLTDSFIYLALGAVLALAIAVAVRKVSVQKA